MYKRRKLFCEISPITYKISVIKCRIIRHLQNLFISNFASEKNNNLLPHIIYKQSSLIRRKLGNVDPVLQDNKAVNLSISTPKVSGIIINPNEIFSFWKLVGSCSVRKGYKEGLMISSGSTTKGVGGGMCQFTNLIHWMVLHTPMQIVEHHHHDSIDLFPDYGRQIPFGTGTSIVYNYLDYRFKNTTDITYQLITYTTGKYLHGEIRADKALDCKYHIKAEDEYFSKEDSNVYRNGKVFRYCIDIKTGNLLSKELIKLNHAKVMYDVSSNLGNGG
ncbi:MAG: VanW family protein [Tissierellia bacterium]|nr:VanW family protein [Tissierellia bacterium]MDD4780781.1 VanW family protein [Tissierellia bacterium]